MRILFLTSRFPYPPYRGDKLKIFNLIRQLSARHEIMLLSFIQNRSEEQWVPELRKYCAQVRVRHLPTVRSLGNCLMAVASRKPFQVAYFCSATMRRDVDEAIREFRPAVIHTHLIRMAPYAADLKQAVRVVDLTDAVSLYLRRFAGIQRNPIKRLALHMELYRMSRFESVIAKFDRALVCSSIDRDALQATVPNAQIRIMENGVDLSAFAPRRDGEQSEPRRVIFTGNMSYYPNADGARFLAQEIFPLVRAEVPDARLYIVGQRPPQSVRALAGDGILVTGFVEDIRAEYLRSAVAVSPIRFGAGTLNKILEPLALGVPVVATSCGTEGLGLLPGRDLLVAEDAKGLAFHIIRVLTDPVLQRGLAEAGPQSVRARFGWEAIATTLENVYGEILPTASHSIREHHRA